MRITSCVVSRLQNETGFPFEKSRNRLLSNTSRPIGLGNTHFSWVSMPKGFVAYGQSVIAFCLNNAARFACHPRVTSQRREHDNSSLVEWPMRCVIIFESLVFCFFPYWRTATWANDHSRKRNLEKKKLMRPDIKKKILNSVRKSHFYGKIRGQSKKKKL